jgi:hypothetical protein
MAVEQKAAKMPAQLGTTRSACQQHAAAARLSPQTRLTPVLLQALEVLQKDLQKDYESMPKRHQ